MLNVHKLHRMVLQNIGVDTVIAKKIIFTLDQFLLSQSLELYVQYKTQIKEIMKNEPMKCKLNVKLMQEFVDWSDIYIKTPEFVLMFKDICCEAMILFKIDKKLINIK